MSNPTIISQFDTVCDAIRDVHDEASLWKLSDELVKIAPAGVESVERVVAQAEARGIPTKSANTLRLYRDVAIRFPATERVELVSFSAHREAIAVGDVKQARQILTELAKQHGPAGVTVTTVKSAVEAFTGKAPTKKGASKTQSSYASVFVDLSTNSGKVFIAEIPKLVDTNNVTLDGLHTGLTKVLAEVEKLRAKAVQKSARAKRPEKPVNPRTSPAARHARSKAESGAAKVPAGAATKPRGGKAGDLRDL